MKINCLNYGSMPFRAQEAKDEVKAKYIGGNDDTGYKVNVRTAHPKGLIGDAGYLLYFETKDEAKDYEKKVNSTHQVVPYQLPERWANAPTSLVVNTYKNNE